LPYYIVNSFQGYRFEQPARGNVVSDIEVLVRSRHTSRGSLPIPDALRVVISGSYRRDSEGLRSIFDRLVALGCEIVSPQSVDFVTERDGFVLRQSEIDEEPHSIEEMHLDAIRGADFVWLHASEGYVGPSASLELGFAVALGIPVFSATTLADPVAHSYVSLVSSPDEAVDRAKTGLLGQPGTALRALQLYYDTTARRRGYDKESPQDTMLLLTEELGELARAVRKYVGLQRDGDYSDAGVREEVADVQLYLVHLANVLGTDLAAAVTDKERINDRRRRAELSRPA
jgi:NTP pyrophosphatase (non-canonical NTP hydrolase)